MERDLASRGARKRKECENEGSGAEFSPGTERVTEEYRAERKREREMHGNRDRPANPHVYILLINPDYHFLIGLLRLPRNKVTLPNELNLQFTIGALFPLRCFSFFFFFYLPYWSRVGAASLSVACGLTPHQLTAKCSGHTCALLWGLANQWG